MATGLMDLADASEVVEGVTVKGANGKGIAYLFARFPELRMLVTGRADLIDANRITIVAPDAIGAIIAVGCGYYPTGKDDDAERQKAAEEKAGSLVIGIQVLFLEAIIRLTMPKGVGPFVATLERIGGYAGEGFGPGAGTISGPQSSKSDGITS